MAIPKLDVCPKCKGHLMLEKDNFGTYQQCLQCGYLHDLETFPIIVKETAEDNEEPVATHYVSPKGSRAAFRDAARLIENSAIAALANALDSQPILDALRKRHLENRQ